MFHYTIFDTTDGRILRVYTKTSEGLHPNDVGLDESYVDGEYGQDYYVTGGVAVLRPLIPVMEGPTYDLNQLPVGSNLVITDLYGAETVVPAQDDMVELVDAGTYKVRSQSDFPYIDFEVEITV